MLPLGNTKTPGVSDFDFVKRRILFCLPKDSPFLLLKLNKQVGLKHVELLPPKKKNLHFISVLNCRGECPCSIEYVGGVGGVWYYIYQGVLWFNVSEFFLLICYQ